MADSTAPKTSKRPRSKEDNPIWQHHQKNVDEGTYVKNDDGSISTVYTTIMGDGEYEYLIPQVWDGKILSEDEAWERAMSSGIDWPREPAGEEGVRKLEQLDKELHEGMSGYADGGQVKSMEEQMNLFEYGGLADDGMDREPVTGNEIPPGSMAKEVRDDVPAMLSEGEYVVPADVVRYYGVKFFEDLRSEAKSGMLDMEEDGRIGGEPVNGNGIPMEGQEEEELTPEEMAMLQEALASDMPQMAKGGMVKGYAPGGDVTQPQFTYNPGQPYPMGSAYGVGAYSPTGGFEARQYVNEQTGQVRTFQFLNGQPISYIPPNFKPYVGATQQSQKTTTTLDDDVAALVKKYGEEGDGKDAMDPGATRGRSYDTMTDDEIAEAEKSLNQQKDVIGTLGLFTGPLGLLAGLANRIERNQLEKAKNMPLESRMENRYQGTYQETTPQGVMVFSPTDDTTRPPDLPTSVQARWSNQQPNQQPPAPVPNITTTTLAQAPQSFQPTPSVPATPTAPTGLPGTAETPAGTKAEPMFAYTSGNVAPSPTPPSEPATPSLQAPSFPSIQAQQQALDVALDEAIFGIDTPQTGGLFGGKDVTPDVVANVATQAAIARAANMESNVSIDAFGGKGPNVGPTSTSPSVSISAASPSISSAMSAARSGFGTSKGGEYEGTPTDTSVNNAYSGLANAVGDPNTSSPTSGTANSNAPSSAQSAASMGFGTSRGGEFSGGADPAGPTGGGKGGGGADSGQAAAAADAANSGPTAGGVSADTADDGTVGDIGALYNKGGLVTKKKKKRKGLGGRP